MAIWLGLVKAKESIPPLSESKDALAWLSRSSQLILQYVIPNYGDKALSYWKTAL
jgi:hypothetical protein